MGHITHFYLSNNLSTPQLQSIYSILEQAFSQANWQRDMTESWRASAVYKDQLEQTEIAEILQDCGEIDIWGPYYFHITLYPKLICLGLLYKTSVFAEQRGPALVRNTASVIAKLGAQDYLCICESTSQGFETYLAQGASYEEFLEALENRYRNDESYQHMIFDQASFAELANNDAIWVKAKAP